MKDWNDLASRSLRADLVRAGVTYAKLVSLLAEIGVTDTESAIRNKISRGSFSHVFYMQCMAAIKGAIDN
jgi:predicted NAD/FAD-binding protein